MIAALLLLLLPAGAITPTPRPSPAVRGEETLQNYAARNRLTPRAVADTARIAVMNTRVKLVSYQESRQGSDLVIEGVIQNLLSRDLDLLIKVNAIEDDGRQMSELLEGEAGQKIPANARSRFRARLPRVKPGSVTFTWIDPVGLGGAIETQTDKALRQKEKDCLEFRVVNPNGAAESQSVEVRARNRCETSLPAERVWFLLTVKDRSGQPVGHRYETFHENVPPGAEVRRVVILPVPAGARFEVRQYQPR